MRRLALAAGTVLAVSPATALAATPPLTGSFACEDQSVVQPGDTASCSFPAAFDLHAYDIPERFCDASDGPA